MTILIEEIELRNRINVFEDRRDAGIRLAEKLNRYKDSNGIILAIPSGGVPVAVEVSRCLRLPLDLIVVRKIQIPYNPEAGFGAMDPDGEVILNRELLSRLMLTDDEINNQIKRTAEVISKREKFFRGGKPFPTVNNKHVIIIDDGLASGYTMLSAIRFLKKRFPAIIIVAIPTGHDRAINIIKAEVEEIVCLNVRAGFSFAVADAYRNWYDLTDHEVIEILSKYDLYPLDRKGMYDISSIIDYH